MSNDAILELVKQSEKNNAKAGITGMLLLSGEAFVQVLEGPPKAVNQLFQKIGKDERHHQIELIEFRSTAEPYFKEWNMRLVDLYDLPLDKRSILMNKYESADGCVIIPDRVQLIFSLLLDARAICVGTPWSE